VENFASDIPWQCFRIRRPGIACAPSGKSLGNMGRAEISLGQQTIVKCAEQAQILRYRGSAARPRLLVVDLKKRARRATTTGVTHIAAAQAIARCDLALDSVRDVLAV
jgi:hypothetical protein